MLVLSRIDTMKMTMRLLISAMLMTVFLAGPAAAKQHWHDDKGHWNKHWKHADDDDDREYDHRAGVCYFPPADVRVISEYYAPRYQRLPPGLAKKLARTGHLPPGWEKRIEPLPIVVERQLIALPEGYRRGIIDGQAVIYLPRTQVVIDVAGLFGPR